MYARPDPFIFMLTLHTRSARIMYLFSSMGRSWVMMGSLIYLRRCWWAGGDVGVCEIRIITTTQLFLPMFHSRQHAFSMMCSWCVVGLSPLFSLFFFVSGGICLLRRTTYVFFLQCNIHYQTVSRLIRKTSMFRRGVFNHPSGRGMVLDTFFMGRIGKK